MVLKEVSITQVNKTKQMKNSKVKVKVVKGNIQQALKQFKSKVFDSGHLNELKDRKEFLKPSVVKRKQMKDAVRKQQWDREREEL
jgi:small subunit ribosomal protein S21